MSDLQPPSLPRTLLARWRLRRCALVGRAPTATGRIWVHGPGRVELGDGVILDAAQAPIELKTFHETSIISLGDGVYVGPGTSIEAVLSVRVGSGSRLGPFCKVMDNHFHQLTGDRHVRPPSAPVEVGRDVEIGGRSILLAGAQIGEGARVHPATVVTRRRRIPPHAVARGNPAVVE